jgi:hypothetical protein
MGEIYRIGLNPHKDIYRPAPKGVEMIKGWIRDGTVKDMSPHDVIRGLLK